MGKECNVRSSGRVNTRKIRLDVQPFGYWCIPEGLYYF